jgi:hypothetical protein
MEYGLSVSGIISNLGSPPTSLDESIDHDFMDLRLA